MVDVGAVVSVGGGGGVTVPPMTCWVVLTTVPWAERACSQSRNAARFAGVTEYWSQSFAHTWWKTSCSQPPPCCSARVTWASMSARVWVSWMLSPALVAHVSAGGMVSA